MSGNTQTLRLRRPDTTPKPKPAERHTGILQDQLRRSAKRPWAPSASLAFRVLFLIRFAGAMFANIDDCDEVFNFWEPLHMFDKGHGFQTWETSPQYAIRSWAYIIFHSLPVKLGGLLFKHEKRPSFFAVRIFLALICTLCEVRFYRTVYSKINERVGRYLFFMLLTSAGMWNASTAFLPSSFAMYATLFAFSYALEPVTSRGTQRTLFATVIFAAGAIVGWPFSLALSVPFVWEELFVYGGDIVPTKARANWMRKRWERLLGSGVVAALLLVPVVGIDSLAYHKLVVVPWNIVQYNIFGGSARGPELYGTAPWNYYLLNLTLNFNVLTPLALVSLPALAVSYFVDRKRLGDKKSSAEQSSPFTLLALRLLPFYLWLGILTSQAHKEERFMFPAYPLICLNAAITLYLVRGWMEVAFISFTKSPYQASVSTVFRRFTFSVVVGAALISLSRIVALYKYYHAPLDVAFALESKEIHRLYNATGLIPLQTGHTTADELPRIDLSLIKYFDLTLCLGKEWHRFMGHYLIPDGVQVEFIKSEFNGLLPGHFPSDGNSTVDGLAALWPRPATSVVPSGLNDLNKEEPSHYVPVEQCDYLVDLDYPLHPTSSPLEPRYAADEETWDRAFCTKFLDARHSWILTRTLWLPGASWQQWNEYGDYCLLRRRDSVAGKEKIVMGLVNDGKIQVSK